MESEETLRAQFEEELEDSFISDGSIPSNGNRLSRALSLSHIFSAADSVEI